MSNKLKIVLLTLIFNQLAHADDVINLGSVAEYNAIVFGHFKASSSDVEGRMAVQGDVDINNYSVGDKLDPNQLHNTLISGGDINFPSGRVYYGNVIAAGNVSGIGAPVSNGMQPGSVITGNASLPLDFDVAFNELTALSQSLRQLTVNTTFDAQWGGLYLQGDCSSVTQVFELDGSQVLDAHTFQVDCIPNDAYVIFNISGQDPGLTNMSMDTLSSHREKVIYNFYEAQTLTLSGIGVEGTILAPYADINNPQGVIKGQLIAQSWDGMMQINNNLFQGVVETGNQAPIAFDQSFDVETDEVLTFSLSTNEPNNDQLTFNFESEPVLGQIEGNAPDLTYTPLLGFVGVEQLTYTVSDGSLESESAVVTFNVGQTQCDLYPLSIEQDRLNGIQPGDVVKNYATSVGAGNYSLLTWNGANDTNTLAASFTQPGDSYNYLNPENTNDQVVSIGDWVQGVPGKKNARHVRDALDDLLGASIVVPVWSDTRGSGSNFDYEVAEFARIELTDYKLNGQSKISFIYQETVNCGNFAPFTLDASTSTEQNQVVTFALTDSEGDINGVPQLLAVIDADQDDLTFTITNQPTHGNLSGTGPEFTYTPTTGFAGNDSFDFKVNDGTTNSNISTISITVVQNNQAPVADGQNLQLNENQAISITLTGTDSDNDSLIFNLETLPLNGQLTGTPPVLNYTPNTDFYGSDVFTFTVSDGQETSAPAEINIEVLAVNDAPIAADLSLNASEDMPINLTLIGSDPDGDVITFQLLAQPTSGVLTGAAPDLTYTPNTDFNGTDSFTYSVNDGQLNSNLATVSITVNPANDAPVANDLSVTTDEDVAVGLTLSGSDPEGDTLTFNVLSQPINGFLSGSAPNLNYTPYTNFNGNDSFTYSVNDGQLNSNLATVSITVNPANDAPVANDLSVTTDEDVAVNLNLLGSDPEGDALTFNVQSQPTDGTLSGAGDTYIYLPNADFNGTDSFTYSVNDGLLNSNVATVSITVTEGNDAPVANDLSVTTDEDVAVGLTLFGSDPEGDALTFDVLSQPTDGTLSGAGDTYTYLPNADFNGTDSFTYSVNDGSLDSNVATVNLTINPINDAPVADPVSITVGEDGSVQIILSGSDIDGDALGFVLDSQPANGTLTGSGDTFTYTPNTDYNGADGFTYFVNDGTSDSATVAVSITVTASNDAPVADDLNITTDEDSAAVITLSGSDPESDVLIFQVLTQPNNGVLSGTAPDLIYTPNTDFNGSDEFTYYVNDGSIDSAAVAVSITVNAANDEPVANNSSVDTNEDTSVNLTLFGSDPDSDSLTYQLVSEPVNGVLSGTAPDFIFTPNANFNGTDTLTYSVNDGLLDSNVATVLLTVAAINDAPIANAQNYVVDEDGTLAILLSGSDVDGDVLSFVLDTQPTDGTLIGTADSYTYTPNTNFNGTDSFTYHVNDGTVDSAVVEVTITVSSTNDAPVASDLTIATDEDTAKAITLSASDPEGDALTYQVITQPTNGVLSGTAPDLTYTPNADFNGADSFTYSVNDGVLDSNVATVNITINSANDAPTANNATVTTDEDTAAVIVLSGSDPEGEALTFQVITQPINGVLSGTAPELSFTPNNNFNGTDSFTYSVNDGSLDSIVATFSITVTPVNDVPVADEQVVDVDEDNDVPITLTGTDVDGDSLTFVIVTQPANGTLIGAGENYSYTPNANFSGTDIFEFYVNDGTVDSAPKNVSITINADNDAPRAHDAAIITDEDVNVNITLSASDPEGDSLTFQVITQPVHGSLTGTAPALVYNPNEDFNGSDAFTFLVNDGQVDSTVATVSITVNPVNDLPVVADQALSVAEDTAFNIDVTGIDDDGDVLTYQISTAPISGLITGDLPVVSYQPNENFYGQDIWVVEINDGQGGVVTANITIDVTAVNDKPTAEQLFLTTAFNTTLELALSGTDVEDTSVNFQIIDQPSNGQISENAGVFTYTPNNGFSGEDTATYVATDSEGLSSSIQNIVVTVEPNDNLPPEITTIAPTSGSVNSDIQYDVDAIDPDGDVLNYSLAEAPVSTSIDAISGLLSWVPETANSIGLQSANNQCELINNQAANSREVQLITLIDGSGSMSDERAYLSTWLPKLNGGLLAIGLGQNDTLEYAVGRFERTGKLQVLPSGKYFGDIDEISNVLVPISDLTGPGGGRENGVNSLISVLENYSFNEAAQQVFIMLTDEGCASCPNAPQYTVQLNEMLASRNDVLHNVIPTGAMSCPDGTPVMGIDSHYNGYVALSNGKFQMCQNADFESLNANGFEHYVEPAFLTGGSVWDVNLISGFDEDSRSASESIARVIARFVQQEIATEALADLYVSNIQIADAEMNLSIGNRGMVVSSPTTVSVTDINNQTVSLSVAELIAGSSVELTVDISSMADGNLQVSIDSQSECLTDNNNLSVAYFNVQVDDGNNGQDQQAFYLTATENNVPPVIQPIADFETVAGATLSIQLDAMDDNKGDWLTYAIVNGSEQALISSDGLLQWKPESTDVGIVHDFTLSVTDLAGATAQTSFQINVNGSIDPLFINSEPVRHAIFGTNYWYQLEVTHDPLSVIEYQLLNSPDGMTISDQGLISWNVPVDYAETVITLVISAGDQFGNIDTQAFLVATDEPAEAPFITSQPDFVTPQGEVFSYYSFFTDTNAFESFDVEFLQAPVGLVINNYDQPFPDFQYDVRAIHRKPGADTLLPESRFNMNHWCGSNDSEWHNLAPQIDQLVEIGPRVGDTLTANLIATALTDTNGDGQTNQDDTQFLIHTFEYGIAAMNLETLEQSWLQPDVRAANGGFSHVLAAADINQDGYIEVLVMAIDGYLKALSHEGDILWSSEARSHSGLATGTMVMTYDLDADGDLEIIAGTHVFDHTGALLIDMGQLNFTAPTYAAVGDLDQDGTLEIIHHNTIFNHDGSIYFDGLGDANFYAIANFDDDPELEFVQVKKFINSVILFDHDGSVIWEQYVQTANLPSVADVDHDGMLEIVMTHAALKADGTIIRDQGGDHRYDSVLTDLNADGAFELISSWNQLIVKDPITGDKIFNWSRSRSYYDFALVDRNHDGEYQILFPHFGAAVYLDIISSADGGWIGGPGETRQSVYNSTVSPSFEANLSYGTLLEQTYENDLTPDFHVTGPQIREVTGGHKIYTELRNLSPNAYTGDLLISFYRDAVDANEFLGSTLITDLDMYEVKTVDLEGLTDIESFTADRLIAVLDPVTPVVECQIENNQASAEYVYWQVTDSTGLFDQQAYTMRVKKPDLLSYGVAALPLAYAQQNFEENFVLLGNGSDLETFFQVYEKPQGMNISSTGQVSWIPTIEQIGQHTILMYLTNDLGNSQRVSTTITVEPPLNLPPYFTSSPSQALYPEVQFEYPVRAIDPEGGAVDFALVTAPTGMSIDANGLLTWTPTATDLGEFDVVIEITDDAGLTAQQSFTINVISVGNDAPVITSEPNLAALLLNDTFQYQIAATDANGDAISYAITQGPATAQLDTAGLLTYSADSLGEKTFEVEARDTQGAWSRQSFTLYVNDTPNTAPVIINSLPNVHPFNGTDYSHQVLASDAENDALNYRLLQAPLGMGVNALGTITWPAASISAGIFTVEIEVNDGLGGFARQSIDLFVGNGNFAPVIESQPPNQANINRLYQYAMQVTDPDDTNLIYELIQAPDGMVIDNEGLISWTPSALGEFSVIAQVADGTGFAQQSWNIEVTENTSQLDVQISLSPSQILPNEVVSVSVQVIGAVGDPTVTATFDGEPLNLDANLEAQVSTDALGSHSIVVTVTDDFETVVSEAVFVVTEIIDFTPPEVDILSPSDGGIITGFNDVQVRVQDANIASWKLSYRYAEDDFTGRVTLAEGTGNVDDAVVANWDTSLLRNGIYVLLIEAMDVNDERSSVAHSVFLEGDLKLGHFSIAFEDMSIPVAGMPVTITRGYDTRDRNRDRAFGKGWSIGFQSVRLQESRVPGLAWYQQTNFFSIGPVTLPRYCIEPAGQPLVSVVLPDGEVEKFKVKARTVSPSSDLLSNCQDITPPDLFDVEFVPQGDTNSQLVSTNGQAGLRVINGNLQELAGEGPIDPNLYTLTMLDGTEYSLDQGFNVVKIKATTGHELRFTEAGIEHSGGLSVAFIRDTEGRITRIEKANGEGVDYAYDTNGDLVSFTDLNGNTTTFTYIQDHYLEDIIDPRGIRVARNEYDADGRLIAHIDADGNRIEYDNDLIAMTSTITDRRGNPTVNAFDNAGNIIAQTNALGETTSYEYNNLRLETARINDLGHRTEWTYDLQGNQLTEKDPLGHITTSTYNRKGELLTQVDALNQPVISNVYNPDYNPLTPSNPQNGYAQLDTVTDALGRTTQFHWVSGINASTGESISVNTGYTDTAGNRYDISPISGGTNDGLSGASTDLNGLRTETTYDDEARPLTETQVITDEFGTELARYTTTYEYNSNGDVVKMTDALGNITRTEYDALNKVSATIDALGRRTEMEYDDRGNQVLTRYPDGSTETQVYDAENNVVESTDRAGRTTQTIYDALNRVEAVIYPDETPGDDTDNPMTVNSYDAAGRLVAVSDAGGNVTSYEYDEAGRRTKTIDALLNETSSVYDALGRRTQSTDALGRVTTFEYNALGNLERTNFDNGLFTTVEYDQLSRKVAETDLAGLRTEYEYDAAGNLIAVIDALGQRTEYSYDQRGNKLTQTDARGNTTSWTYDALSRVTSRTLPMGEFESYTYDAVGNRISKTDFNGDTTTYEYNNLNQLVLTTYSDFTTVANTYTITGQMETVTEINGTTTYSYDSQDRLIRIDYPTGNYIEYGYDLNGNKTEVTTANQTVTNTYDELNRLKTVTDSSGTTTYTYDAVGNRASQINANGTVATYSYDALNRLEDLVHTDSLNVEIASYSYELGPNGNRLSLTEGTGRVVEYGYDALYRLETETVTDAINGNHFSQWSYDAVGNRLQQDIDGVVTTYSYNNNDHLLTETENGIITSYVYDANGNTLTKTVGAALDAEYTYSKDNRMVTANTGTSSISYSYDAGGIRQSQTVDGVITHYLVDPNRSYHQVLEEQDDLFLPQVVYTYGDDLINQTNDQGVHTFGYDGLGSTRILTDASGVVQNSYGYQAFGELDYEYGSVENNYLFTGEQYDNNVGFYYLRARYYNPEIGRFSQMDVFPGMQFEPVTLHKYLYANVNPVIVIDPSGNVGVIRMMTGINVLGNIQGYGSIGVNILTGNYAVAAGQLAEEVVYGKLGALGRPLSKLSERGLNLFYNILGKNIKLSRGVAVTGANLAKNLERVGVRRPPNTQAHHIVAGHADGADRARTVLKRFDIDLNAPNNGVYLPKNASSPAAGSFHSGPHPPEYYAEVNRRIIAAASGGKIEVLNELGKIKIDLLQGLLPVRY